MTTNDIAPSGDDSPQRAAHATSSQRRSRCSASTAIEPNITAGRNVSRPPHRFTPQPQANSTTPTTGSGRPGFVVCHRSTTQDEAPRRDEDRDHGDRNHTEHDRRPSATRCRSPAMGGRRTTGCSTSARPDSPARPGSAHWRSPAKDGLTSRYARQRTAGSPIPIQRTRRDSMSFTAGSGQAPPMEQKTSPSRRYAGLSPSRIHPTTAIFVRPTIRRRMSNQNWDPNVRATR